MKPTLRKLDEADLLLSQATASSDDYKVFIANLNGFISAARSVTLIMQKEFSGRSEFKNWYEQKQNEMRNDPDLPFFNSMRTDTIHTRPVNTGIKITNNPVEPIDIGTEEVTIASITIDKNGYYQPDPSTQVPSIKGKPITDTRIETKITYYFVERTDDDAIQLCQSYLAKLKKLVNECYAKLG